jgi:hypothetical protein
VEDELSPQYSDLDKLCKSPKCVILGSWSEEIQEMIPRIVFTGPPLLKRFCYTPPTRYVVSYVCLLKKEGSKVGPSGLSSFYTVRCRVPEI